MRTEAQEPLSPPAGLVERIDADPRDWAARSILADWYFDQGRDDLYEAWTWLNEEGRVPEHWKGYICGWFSQAFGPGMDWRRLPVLVANAMSPDDETMLLIQHEDDEPFHHLRRAAEVIARDRPALPRGLPR